MLVDNRRRSSIRLGWTLVFGFFLGGLFTGLAERFLPDGAPRTFLMTSVSASLGPVSMDLVAVALTLGPVTVYLNVLTLLGVAIVAFVARSWI
jgi:hypothetical protein